MHGSQDADELAIVAAFLETLLRDREHDRVATVEEYQRRYPGFESAIEREFDRVLSGDLTVTQREPTLELTDSAVLPADAQPVSGSTAERYQQEQELARGGMGTIYRAWDPSLRRTVAKKVLGHDDRGGTPASGSGMVERFLEEAEVTAQLEHPGIVPVHELGVDSEGHVYFTMSLVRGRNFKEIIDLVREEREGWNQTRALGVLQRVCEAVAFAHSKDVIHRDLKPANIMVGQFGETYVMDWGLARVGDSEGPAVSGRIRSSRRDAAASDPISPLATMEGDVVGTPGYMAPEQARGELETVGPRSDVYSIGAMLYHLLTGAMPYKDHADGGWKAVVERVRVSAPAPVRDKVRDAPEELLSICERAMAREPQDRYAGAGELGEDIRAFLENRVVRAHRTGAIAELRKWVRRNRLAAAAAGVAFVSLATGLVTSLWLKGRADENAEVAAANAQQAADNAEQAATNARRADENAARAEAAYQGALDAVERMLSEVSGPTLANIPGADPVRRKLLLDAKELYDRFITEQGDRPEMRRRVATTFGQLAVVHRGLGDRAEHDRYWKLAAEAFEAEFREHPDADLAERLAWAHKPLAQIATNAGNYDEAESILRRSAELLDEALAKYPDDIYLMFRRARVDDELGYMYGSAGRNDEALEHSSLAFEAIGELLERPDSTSEMRQSYGNIGKNLSWLLVRASELDRAEEVADRAIEVFEELLVEDPDDRASRSGLAMALNHRGLVDNARGDSDAHLATTDRSLEIVRRLVADFPLDPAYASTLAQTLHNRALLTQWGGDVEAALELQDQSVASQRRALEIAPGHGLYLRRLRNNVSSRLVMLKILGRYRQLADDVDQLVEIAGEDHRAWRHAGSMLFSAAGLSAQDESMSEDEREQAMARGAEYVRKALSLGFRDLRWFDGEDLEAVREHPVFVQLRKDAVELAKGDGRE